MNQPVNHQNEQKQVNTGPQNRGQPMRPQAGMPQGGVPTQNRQPLQSRPPLQQGGVPPMGRPMPPQQGMPMRNNMRPMQPQQGGMPQQRTGQPPYPMDRNMQQPYVNRPVTGFQQPAPYMQQPIQQEQIAKPEQPFEQPQQPIVSEETPQPFVQPQEESKEQNPYFPNFATDFNLSPTVISTKGVLAMGFGSLIVGVLLGIIFFGGGSSKPQQPVGLQGVIRNTEISPKLPRCGRIDRGQSCVLYIMNSSRNDKLAEEFFNEAVKLTEIQKYSIAMANPKYAKTRIPPGYFAEIKIPDMR